VRLILLSLVAVRRVSLFLSLSVALSSAFQTPSEGFRLALAR
jgi:hypothetical protein